MRQSAIWVSFPMYFLPAYVFSSVSPIAFILLSYFSKFWFQFLLLSHLSRAPFEAEDCFEAHWQDVKSLGTSPQALPLDSYLSLEILSFVKPSLMLLLSSFLNKRLQSEGRFESLVCICLAQLSLPFLSLICLWPSLQVQQRRSFFSSLPAFVQCEDLLPRCCLTSLTIFLNKEYSNSARRMEFELVFISFLWRNHGMLYPFQAISCRLPSSVLSAVLPRFALNVWQ